MKKLNVKLRDGIPAAKPPAAVPAPECERPMPQVARLLFTHLLSLGMEVEAKAALQAAEEADALAKGLSTQHKWLQHNKLLLGLLARDHPQVTAGPYSQKVSEAMGWIDRMDAIYQSAIKAFEHSRVIVADTLAATTTAAQPSVPFDAHEN